MRSLGALTVWNSNQMLSIRRHDIEAGLRDIIEGTSNWPVWATLGWLDIRRRYRRSTFGPLWLTLSMGVTVGSLAVLWSWIFNTSTAEFVPHLTLGFMTWYLISNLFNEGCYIFVGAAGYIKQMKQPFFLYFFWAVWRNVIIFLHNLVVYAPVVLIYHVPLNAYTLLIVATFPLAVLSVGWFSLLCGMISARYRDVPQIVTNLVGILFYLTPIIWKPEQLGDRRYIADFNPLTAVVELIRKPLLGQAPAESDWLIVIGLIIVGWGLTALIYARFRARIPYWL